MKKKELTLEGNGNVNAILTSANLTINVINARSIRNGSDKYTQFIVTLNNANDVRYFGPEYKIDRLGE